MDSLDVVLQISPNFVSFMHIVSVALGWGTGSVTVQCYTAGLKTHKTDLLFSAELGIVDPLQVRVVYISQQQCWAVWGISLYCAN